MTGGQEWRHKPPLGPEGTRPVVRSRRGEGVVQEMAGGRMKPRRNNPQGLKGELATTSRAEKGGQPEGGRGGRNGLAARGCRGCHGPVDQFEGGKTVSSGRAVEAGGNERLFREAAQDRN